MIQSIKQSEYAFPLSPFPSFWFCWGVLFLKSRSILKASFSVETKKKEDDKPIAIARIWKKSRIKCLVFDWSQASQECWMCGSLFSSGIDLNVLVACKSRVLGWRKLTIGGVEIWPCLLVRTVFLVLCRWWGWHSFWFSLFLVTKTVF